MKYLPKFGPNIIIGLKGGNHETDVHSSNLGSVLLSTANSNRLSFWGAGQSLSFEGEANIDLHRSSAQRVSMAGITLSWQNRFSGGDNNANYQSGSGRDQRVTGGVSNGKPCIIIEPVDTPSSGW